MTEIIWYNAGQVGWGVIPPHAFSRTCVLSFYLHLRSLIIGPTPPACYPSTGPGGAFVSFHPPGLSDKADWITRRLCGAPIHCCHGHGHRHCGVVVVGCGARPVIPALSFVFTAASALAVGCGAAARPPAVCVPALVGLVCSAFLHGLPYWVFMEGRRSLNTQRSPGKRCGTTRTTPLSKLMEAPGCDLVHKRLACGIVVRRFMLNANSPQGRRAATKGDSMDDVLEAINRAPDDWWREKVLRELEAHDPRALQEVG